MAIHPTKWCKVVESVVKSMPDETKSPNELPENRAIPAVDSDSLGFTGCYNHGIDAKGRVIVPASYRRMLGDQFVAALTIDKKAIALYPTAGWIVERNKLKALSDKDARFTPIYGFMCKYAFLNCETDAQGRVLLPAKLRNRVLGNAQNAEVSGAGNYVRIVEASGQRTEVPHE